jgi:hypothetical protein
MPKRKRRKLTSAQKWVVGLGLLVAVLGLINLGRMAMALRTARILPELPMSVSYSYLAVTGGFWGVVLVACAVSLLRFYRRARWATLAAATLYEIHTWVNRLLFDASDYARQVRLQDLALTILFLAFTWILLNVPFGRRVFAPEYQETQ